MTFLEFIRKNLLIAVIVIVGILVGLIMMDYGNSGSAFSRDYRIEVNGTRYKAQYTMTNGSKTQYYLARMQRNDIFALWGLGVLDQAEENYAVNRLLLREAAAELGISPSNEEIDEYIKTRIPAFQTDNQFDYDAYKELIGYNNGELNSAAENDVRELVSDMIIHDTIKQIVAANVSENKDAKKKVEEASNQNISGVRAMLQLANQAEPEAPSAEVLKQYWEERQNKYMTEEKRAFTVIKLSGNKIGGPASIIQEALVKAPASAPEEVITAKLSECELEDYSIQNYGECTVSTAPDALKQIKLKPLDDNEVSLNEIVFNSALTSQTAGQYSTYYTEEGDLNSYIIRIDSIVPAVPQSFEQAEEAARKDWIAEERLKLFHANAVLLQNTIGEALAAGKDMKTAFEAATAAGANVEEFTDAPLNAVAATGAQTASQLRRTHSGSLAPIVKTPTEVVITGISKRTIAPIQEDLMMEQLNNMIMTEALMHDWIISAYSHYKVVVPQTEE